MRSRMLPTWLCVSAAFAAVSALYGCNIVGPAMVLVSGPPKTEAAYEIDPTRTHVVMIDDLRSRFPKRSLRDLACKTVEERLLEEGVLKPDKLLSSRAAYQVAASEKYGQPLTIVEIGRRVGADVIIYVTIDWFTITKDGATASPFVQSRVKVLDAKNNDRLWPANEEGYSLIVAPNKSQGELPKDLGGRAAMEQAVTKQFALAVAQLFYTHETKDSATR